MTDPDVLTLLRDRTEGDFAASNGAQVAMRALGERALPGLIEAVERSDVPLPHQWEAVNALAEIRAPAVEGLIGVLTAKDTAIEQRWVAGEALGYIQKSSTVALLRALTHPDSEARRAAAYALISCKDPRAVPALLDAVNDPDPEVGLLATKALRHTCDASCEPSLRAVLASGNCASRVAVVWALDALTDSASG
jgi:HEAT repeat protein